MKNHIKKDRLHIHNIVAFNLTIYYFGRSGRNLAFVAGLLFLHIDCT